MKIEGRFNPIAAPNAEPTECVHDDSTRSTLRTVYASGGGVGVEFWFVECRVCHKLTHPYLTQGEAWKRALKGWW